MSDQKVTTVNGVEVRLFEAVLERIFRKHGELRNMTKRILETLHSPEVVLVGHGKELLAVRHYSTTPLGSKDMVVVYREDRHLIITAFLTSSRVKLERKREIAWQEQSR